MNSIDVFHVLKMMYPCKDLFQRCWWRWHLVDCCQLFSFQRTKYGFCYSFNSFTSDQSEFKMVRLKMFQDIRIFRLVTISVFSQKHSELLWPLHSYNSVLGGGLRVIYDTNRYVDGTRNRTPGMTVSDYWKICFKTMKVWTIVWFSWNFEDDCAWKWRMAADRKFHSGWKCRWHCCDAKHLFDLVKTEKFRSKPQTMHFRWRKKPKNFQTKIEHSMHSILQNNEIEDIMHIEGLPYLRSNCIADCHRRNMVYYCNCSVDIFYPGKRLSIKQAMEIKIYLWKSFHPTDDDYPDCNFTGMRCLSKYNRKCLVNFITFMTS